MPPVHRRPLARVGFDEVGRVVLVEELPERQELPCPPWERSSLRAERGTGKSPPYQRELDVRV